MIVTGTVRGSAAADTRARGDLPAAVALPSLTGLRFVAAFLVFGFHMNIMHLLDTGTVGMLFGWLFANGSGGFSFFFLLSGFVLVWSSRPGDTVLRFWRRRIARIYPNHLVTWILTAIVLAVGARLTFGVAVLNLALVHAWLPDRRVYFGMNTVSWSLGCELFFYLLFPLLRRGLVRLPDRALWPSAGAMLAIVWLVPLTAQLVPDGYRYWLIWVFPVARLPEFVTGMLLARIVLAGRWPSLGVKPAAALAVAAYVGCRWLPDDWTLVAGMAVPLALLVGALAAADASGRPTRWTSIGLLWLSEVSFAFYLVHHLALRFVIHLAGTSRPAWFEALLAAGALVLALVASWLMYRFVEVPGRRLLAPHRRPTPSPTTS